MQRRLPPLNALRAFDAAARHLSFTAAADELNVTQGAVSRHVKSLEGSLGIALFRRLGKQGLQLTDAGHALQPGLADAFERMEQAVAQAQSGQDDLCIKVLPTIATRWLIPRLRQFEADHPDIPLRVTTAWRGYRPDVEDFDAAIVYSAPDYGFEMRPSLRQDLILTERMCPVCTPDLLHSGPALQQPEDLARHTLIHSSPDHYDWKFWLRAQGLPASLMKRNMDFDYLDIALSSALSGHGVALADLAMVRDELASGRLIRLFDLPAQEIGAYYLVSPKRAGENPLLAIFRDWLLVEGAATSAVAG